MTVKRNTKNRITAWGVLVLLGGGVGCNWFSSRNDDHRPEYQRDTQLVDAPHRADDGDVHRKMVPRDIALVPVEIDESAHLPSASDLKHWHHVLETARTQLAQQRPWDMQVRTLLERILLHSEGIPPDILKKIKTYMIASWLHGGRINRISKKKITPKFIPGQLGAATLIALKNGADIDYSAVDGIALDADNMSQLEAFIRELRPWMYREIETETSRDTEDTAACLGYSIGVPVTGIESRYTVDFLNFADKWDRLVREVGGRKSAKGRVSFAPVRALDVVDAVGCVGPLIDMTHFVRMGGAYWYKGVDGESFDNGNCGDIDAVVFPRNLNDLYYQRFGNDIFEEFSYNDAMNTRRGKYNSVVNYVYLVLRQLVGFNADGTDQQDPGWLSERLGNAHPVIAALRADLSVLYLVLTTHSGATGLHGDPDAVRAFLDTYIVSVLESLASGVGVDDVDFQAQIVLLNYLIEADAVEVEHRGVLNVFVRVADEDTFRDAVMKLLAEVRAVRFLGDGVTGRTLISTYGYVPAGWEKGLRARWRRLKMPRGVGFVYPLIEQPSGHKEIVLKNATSFYERQLRMAKRFSQKNKNF